MLVKRITTSVLIIGAAVAGMMLQQARSKAGISNVRKITAPVSGGAGDAISHNDRVSSTRARDV